MTSGAATSHDKPGFLALVPARSGSKGIRRKNIRDFLGRPLLCWTVEVARESGVFERIIVSTEDREIAAIARNCASEVPFLRPAHLAEDTAPTAVVVQHAVRWLEREEGWVPDFVMILEPTAPTRRDFHLREAAQLMVHRDADSLASVSEVPHHYNPMKVLRLQTDGTVRGVDGTHVRDMIHRRQDLPSYYAFNGLVFASKTQLLFEDPPTLWGDQVVGYVIDAKYAVDIDSPEDWIVAEARMRAILEEEKQG